MERIAIHDLTTNKITVRDRTSAEQIIVELERAAATAAEISPEDRVEAEMTAEPFKRAWVKRQAAKEGKTPRQIMNEMRDNA